MTLGRAWQEQIKELKGEVIRLQIAKRAALAIADERSKENCALRQENARLQGIIENMREIRTTRDLEQEGNGCRREK